MHNYVPRKSSKRPGEQLPLTGQRLRLEKAFALKARALEKFYQGNFFFSLLVISLSFPNRLKWCLKVWHYMLHFRKERYVSHTYFNAYFWAQF